MTALMVHKPDDHIAFIRECLDKVYFQFSLQFFFIHNFQVQNNPNRVRWDLFVTNTSNTKGTIPSRPALIKNRQKLLPPVRTSISTSKTTQVSDRQTTIKPVALPPIENSEKNSQNLPIIFILSKIFYLQNKNFYFSFSIRFIKFNKIMFKINGTLQ